MSPLSTSNCTQRSVRAVRSSSAGCCNTSSTPAPIPVTQGRKSAIAQMPFDAPAAQVRQQHDTPLAESVLDQSDGIAAQTRRPFELHLQQLQRLLHRRLPQEEVQQVEQVGLESGNRFHSVAGS